MNSQNYLLCTTVLFLVPWGDVKRSLEWVLPHPTKQVPSAFLLGGSPGYRNPLQSFHFELGDVGLVNSDLSGAHFKQQIFGDILNQIMPIPTLEKLLTLN